MGCVNDREWHKQAHDGSQRGTDHKRLINRCFSSANQKSLPEKISDKWMFEDGGLHRLAYQ